MLRIGIVAGEASGDYLGSELIKSLSANHEQISFEGIGGKEMQAVGCRSLFPIEKLSVMGLVEVLSSLTELLMIRKKLKQHFLANPPDVFIGIDAPDFNLGLEEHLRNKGITTVHYVSPSVWAWRQYRLRKISRSVDLMLTLFPFETEVYRQHGIKAEFAGHPLANKIGMRPDKNAARQRLGLKTDQLVIGLMPGSRKSEILRLWPVFLKTAALCLKENKKIHFISNTINEASAAYCEEIEEETLSEKMPVTKYQGRAHDVLEASDLLLLASGTITLEAMLFKKPMVVAYKLNPLSHLLVRSLTCIAHAGLPNILAGRELVPECLQDDCYPEKLFEKLKFWMEKPEAVISLEKDFEDIHKSLKTGAEPLVANAISELIGLSK